MDFIIEMDGFFPISVHVITHGLLRWFFGGPLNV